MVNFDTLTLTATEAQSLLQNGQITSVALVEAYLAQIEAHNHQGLHLNAVISTTPRSTLLSIASNLDTERQRGHLRSGLHGIPIVIKDLFATTGLDLPTTGGAPALGQGKAKRTAPLIEHLIESGMIVLGTANLTEFCGLKYPAMTPGWSPAGGQTQSPFVFGGLEDGEVLLGNSSAGGSSAGSAVAVAAGMAILSVGTECCGSLITPAGRAGVYTLKCGLGTVETQGCFHYTDCIDFIGGMAKSAADLSLLTAALMKRERQFEVGGEFHGLRVGFVNAREWRLPEEVCKWPGDSWEQVESVYNHAISRIRDEGAVVKENIDLETGWSLFKTLDGKSLFYEIAMYHLKNHTIPTFLSDFDFPPSSPVRGMEDIIAYNEAHADTCLPTGHPSQSELHDLVANTTTKDEMDVMFADLRKKGEERIGKLFDEGLDVVVALAESPLCQYSTAIGGPLACMPLGVVKYSEQNERPFGLVAAAKQGGEELLMRFMTAFESIAAPRPLPRPLLRGTT